MPKAYYTSKMFYVYLDGDKVWEYLENGKDVDELYPDNFKLENIQQQYSASLSAMMLEDEEFVLLEGWYSGYAITSMGRGFNVKNNKQIKGYIKANNSDVIFTIRNNKIFMKDLFKQQNWVYNSSVIYNNYINNGWKIQKYTNQL